MAWTLRHVRDEMSVRLQSHFINASSDPAGQPMHFGGDYYGDMTRVQPVSGAHLGLTDHSGVAPDKEMLV